MRIAFEAFWWQKGPFSNRQVLREIIFNWIKEFPLDEIALVVPRADVLATQEELPVGITVLGSRLRPQGLSSIIELPTLVRRFKPDVVVAHNFTPWSGFSALFLQDVLFLSHPEWFTLLERAYFSLMTLTAPRADVVFSSTVTEGRRIQEALSVAGTVCPVGLAVSSTLSGSEPVTPSWPLRTGEFSLTVGRLNVRKNLEFTCLAAIDCEDVTAENPLVIVGSIQGKAMQMSLEIQTAIDDGRIVLLNYATSGELRWLYENCSVFVFMSLDEGFGLPPLEALYFGAQVVASDIPVMREVLSEHAHYVSPTDRGGVTEALRTVNRAQRTGTGPDGAGARYARDKYSYVTTVRAMRQKLEELV